MVMAALAMGIGVGSVLVFPLLLSLSVMPALCWCSHCHCHCFPIVVWQHWVEVPCWGGSLWGSYLVIIKAKNLKKRRKKLVIEQIKKNIPAAQIMLIIVWAAVHSVSVSGVIVSNSNSPYE